MKPWQIGQLAVVLRSAFGFAKSTDLAAYGAKKVAINTQADDYTLVLTDADTQYVRMTKGTATNLTVPLNATVAFEVGSTIPVMQAGAGQVTIVATGGVTINTPETLKLRKQFAGASLVKVATNEWDLIGDLEAAA